MITKEVTQWIKKVQAGQYSYETAMDEFIRFSRFLTPQEMILIKNKIKENLLP